MAESCSVCLLGNGCRRKRRGWRTGSLMVLSVATLMSGGEVCVVGLSNPGWRAQLMQHSRRSGSNTSLNALSKDETVRLKGIIDGGEARALEDLRWSLSGQTSAAKTPKGAPQVVSVVLGTVTEFDGCVVGIEKNGASASSVSTEASLIRVSLGDGTETRIEASTMARVPDRSLSNGDALSTVLACYAILQPIVGSATPSPAQKTVVVLGGNDYACFIANALDVLGYKVHLVTSRGVDGALRDRVSRLPPLLENNSQGSVDGEDDDALGFAEVLGTFDILVDTIHDESRESAGYVYEEVDEEDDPDFLIRRWGGVVYQLKRQHNCKVYLSTLTNAQRIIRDDGVLFGPGKVNAMERDLFRLLETPSSSSVPTVSLLDFGPSVVQPVLNARVMYAKSSLSSSRDHAWYRGWTLQDFWEYTTWPRDSRGNANTRYGLPVLEDLQLEKYYRKQVDEDGDGDYDDEYEYEEEDDGEVLAEESRVGSAAETPKRAKSSNPFVLEIDSVSSFHSTIVAPQRDAVLFLSGSFCRKCQYISPQFSRMARILTTESDEDEQALTFAKATVSLARSKATTGTTAADLGPTLGIRFVPAFVLFRRGERYGSVLSVSKLPSKKLAVAVDYLQSGQEWDGEALEGLE